MGETAGRIRYQRLNERAPHPAKEYTALELAAIFGSAVILSLGALLVCALHAMGVI